MNVTTLYTGGMSVYSQGNASGNGSAGTLGSLNIENKVMNVFSILILTITMTSLGCSMEISKIRGHLFKPKGVAIALVAQFGIMPFTAFCTAKLLRMNDLKAVTLLICGCCPGGTLSNIFSLAIKGDMNLSIVLTTCSSFAALGLMPLMLYIYCQGFANLTHAVPYVSIVTTLVLTLVPCAIGITIKYYKPKYTAMIQKVGFSILVLSSILAVILCGVAVKELLWKVLTPDNLTAAALMPGIGYIMGYVLSLLFRFNAPCRRTISMETGCQNIQLCFAILKVAFPLEVIGPIFLFPLIYMTFQSVEALLLILCFRCYQTFTAPAEDLQECSNVDIKPGEP
ncbi:hepatic sodium/bile acid cotransporter-like [Solea solea]|uniref:hepatic sodium/bile acid cotransporter-like n=1 Tax=Solea solea TaxID=90069 RepID=UPI00272C538D|nr:hepatic sodium/bile acid cotransporter-like [Solea solea]